MTYPIDQIVALTKANGQLALKLADIARTAGEDYAQIGGKAVAAFADQCKALKPMTAPAFGGEAVSGLFGEMEKSREASLARTKAAFDEWQDRCRHVFADADAPRELANGVQRWFQPFLMAETASAKAPPRAPAKAAAAAA